MLEPIATISGDNWLQRLKLLVLFDAIYEEVDGVGADEYHPRIFMQVIDQAIGHGPVFRADDFDGGLEYDTATAISDLGRKGLALVSGSRDQHSFAGQRR